MRSLSKRAQFAVHAEMNEGDFRYLGPLNNNKAPVPDCSLTVARLFKIWYYLENHPFGVELPSQAHAPFAAP